MYVSLLCGCPCYTFNFLSNFSIPELFYFFQKTSASSPVPLPSILRANSSSVPSSPSNSRHTSSQCQKSNHIKQDLAVQGYTPSSVYQTQTSYRSQQYPTFSMRSPSSYSSASSSDYGTYGDKNIPITPLSAPYRNRLVILLFIE